MEFPTNLRILISLSEMVVLYLSVLVSLRVSSSK